MSQLAISNPSQLLSYLQKSKSAIEMALPKHLNPDRMLRLALTAFSTTPALRDCSPQSILSSIVVASQLGLEPGIAGQGYLIPYKGTCTFVPGWQGLVGLLNNSGRATAWAGSVFEGDQFEFELGGAPKCRHVPGNNYGDPDKLVWVYACGKVNGSEQPVIEAWPMARVWKHRDRFNKVGSRHYSFQHPEMYARKVVLLQVLKYMPRSIELNNAMTAANASEMGNNCRVEEGIVVEMPAEEAEPPQVANIGPSTKELPEPAAKPASKAKNTAEKPPAEKPAPKATPLEGLRNLMAASNVSEADLLAVLAPVRSEGVVCTKVDFLTADEIENATTYWEAVVSDVAKLKPAAVDMIPEDKLRGLCADHGVTELAVMQYLVSQKSAAKGTENFDDLAPRVLSWSIENFTAITEAITAQ